MIHNRRSFLQQSLFLGAGLSFGLSLLHTKEENPIPLIIDADTANEVDDLFAIVIGLLEPKLKILGLTAAQWHTSPQAPNNVVGESQKMNVDILRLMNKLDIPHLEGSNFPMVRSNRPQDSDAAQFIIESTRKLPEQEKLSIAILGPATNIASAILLAPEIIPKLKVYYLGFWHNPETNTWSKREFNTNNDPNAVDCLLNTKDLEFNVMTASTSQQLVFQKNIVDQHLKGKKGIADYLVNRWETFDRYWQEADKEKRHWIMWDVAIILAIAAPELATRSAFMSPHDNLERQIGVYTKIDQKKMEARFWVLIDAYLSAKN